MVHCLYYDVTDDGVTEYMQAANVVNSKTGERLGPGKSNLRYTPSFTQRILRRKFEGHLLDASSIKEGKTKAASKFS